MLEIERNDLLRNLWHCMDARCVRRDEQHKKVIKNLPCVIENDREVMYLYPAYTDTVDEHFIVLRWSRKGIFQRQRKIVFQTSDWVRFLRALGPSHQPLRSFSIRSHYNRDNFWRYTVMVHKEKGVVELVSSFREGARTTFGPERQYVNMPISLDLWHQFTREIRRIMPKYATKVIEEHPNGAYVAKLTKVSANGDIATSYVRVGSITELLKQTNVRRSQAE